MNWTQEQDWQARLYQSKAAEMLLYGRALGLSHSEAEDVLHEVFVSLLRLAEAPAQPERYAMRSLRYRALNYHRSLWRRFARELESRRWFERSEEESPKERAAMRCLAALPAEQREAIVLKIWHRYTFDEMGALLGLSPNTVAARYRYGLAKIRSCLKGPDYEQTNEADERSEPDGDSDGLMEATRSFRPA